MAKKPANPRIMNELRGFLGIAVLITGLMVGFFGEEYLSGYTITESCMDYLALIPIVYNGNKLSHLVSNLKLIRTVHQCVYAFDPIGVEITF